MTVAAAPQALLGRVDWRFLLPNADLGDVGILGRPDPALPLALRQAGARLPGRPPYDTVVLVQPRADDLLTARAVLRPGGQLWAEVSRPPWALLSPLPLPLAPLWCARLARAGFVGATAFWLAPHPARTTHVVPLASRAAVAHLAGRSQGSPTGRAKAALLRALLLARVAGLAAPCVGLVAGRQG